MNSLSTHSAKAHLCWKGLTYELVNMVLTSTHTGHFPNLIAVARQLSKSEIESQQTLIAYGHVCVTPGLQYISKIFSDTLKSALEVFKACRFFNPHKIQEMKTEASSLDYIFVIPFMNAEIVSNLKVERPSYLANATDTSHDLCPLIWWQTNSSELPHWSVATSMIVLIQPTSAASERVFSLRNNTFCDKQDASLYVEASLMLQF